MFPPELGPDRRELLVEGMVESVAMAVVATVIGVAISLPVAFMAAENLAPGPVYYTGRGLITVSRAFHELIVAIIVVKAVGFGALAGVIALSFKTIGFFAKLLAEEIEDIDAGQMDAVRATGANGLQTLLFGVVPQVIPRIVGLSIYRWDINVRASTIIGFVGAGGVGVELNSAINFFAWPRVFVILLAILGIVIFSEVTSAYLRRKAR